MNQKTAILINKVAKNSEGKFKARLIKKQWNETPKNKRHTLRETLKKMLEMFKEDANQSKDN